MSVLLSKEVVVMPKRRKWNKPAYVDGYNVHHRLPRSRGGQSTPENLSIVPKEYHEAYNLLFGGNPTAQEVCKVLNEIWIDPAYRLIVVPAKFGDDE